MTIKFTYRTEFRIGYHVPDLQQDLKFSEQQKGYTLIAEAFKDGADCLYTVLTDAEGPSTEGYRPDDLNDYNREHKSCVEALQLSIDYVNHQLITMKVDQSHIAMKHSDTYYDELNRERIARGDVIVHPVAASAGCCVSYRGTGSVPQMKKSLRYAKRAFSSDNHRQALVMFRSGLMSLADPYKDWFKIIEKLRGDNFKGQPLLTKISTQIPNVDADFMGDFPQAFRHHYSNEHGSKAIKKWAHELLPSNAESTRNRYLAELTMAIDFYFDNIS